MTLNYPLFFAFIAYLLIIAWLGLRAYKATNSVDDYVLGGRKLGAAVTALSAGASDMSGWLLLGLPGAIYLSGVKELWIGVGLVIGAYINWRLVAAKLREQSESHGNALTIPSFLQNKVAPGKKSIRIVAALSILLFFSFYISAGMYAGALLFEKVFGLDYLVALLIGSTVIVSYTFVGGYFAVSWTDFFQGVLMLFALLFLPIMAVTEIGGIEHTLNQINQINPNFLDISADFELVGWLSLMAWGLGYFGQPHILARFMAISSVNELPKARRIAVGWSALSLFGALSVGLVGISYFASNPIANSETIFIELTQAVLNPWIAGLLIAAILSAIMSTIDSQILVCSSILTEDVYQSWINKNASEKQLMWVSRIGVLSIAAISVLLASNPSASVLSLVQYAWAGLGCAFGPVILIVLYAKKITSQSVIAGILSGTATVIVWKQLEGGIFDIYEMIPGFAVATILTFITNSITCKD